MVGEKQKISYYFCFIAHGFCARSLMILVKKTIINFAYTDYFTTFAHTKTIINFLNRLKRKAVV